MWFQTADGPVGIEAHPKARAVRPVGREAGGIHPAERTQG